MFVATQFILSIVLCRNEVHPSYRKKEGTNLVNKYISSSRTSCCRQLDGQFDKLTVDRRKYYQLSLTNDGPVYHTNVHLYRLS